MSTIPILAKHLNRLAKQHPIGDLQQIRQDIKHLKRRAGTAIFTNQTTFPRWAWHHGGRTELQFNIGMDGHGERMLRHGVAFDFSASRTLPDPEGALFPKARLLSECLQEFKREIPDMRMWKWSNEKFDPQPVGPFPREWIKKRNFLFFGKLQNARRPDLELILRDFDRLLPLYQLIERTVLPPATDSTIGDSSTFEPGSSTKAGSATFHREPAEVEMELRENVIQDRLYKQLVEKHGRGVVKKEFKTGVRTKVDIVVKHRTGFWFYEIKVARPPRECLRLAIGQLLEYSHWPGCAAAIRLIVVGEFPLDAKGKEYLSILRRKYSLPVSYEHVPLS